MYTAEIVKSINIGGSEVREVIKNSRSIDGISICIYDLSNQQRKLVYQDGV